MATVLLVMKRPGNIRVMKTVLEASGHIAVGTPDNASLRRTLAHADTSPVALIDASGFRPADWRLCQVLRSHQVRFIVLCTAYEARHAGQALGKGATSFLQKPVSKPILLQLLSGLAAENASGATYSMKGPDGL